MLVKQVVRRGAKNARVSLVDGSTALVPADVADSLVGKELPAEFLAGAVPADGGKEAKPKAARPEAVATVVPDIPAEELENFKDI